MSRVGYTMWRCTFWGVLIAGAVQFQANGQQLPSSRENDPSISQASLAPQAEASETLEEAWQVALAVDFRLEASQWQLSAATRTSAAARAEQLPSLTVGANYVALSEEPAFKLPATPILPTRLPFFEQDSGGFHAMVTQPLYTSGRISSGIRAAEAGVAANQAEVARARLDVKMAVAEIYIAALRARRLVDVAENKMSSLAAHVQDVQRLLEKGLVAKNDLLSAQVAFADARQHWLQARNGQAIAHAAYNRALGRPLTEPVKLAELRGSDGTGDVAEWTHEALQNRPEIAQLSSQACALREQAAGVEAKNAPQVALAGGYLFQQDKYIDPNGVAAVGVGVEWNLFDFGRASNQSAALFQRAEAVLRMRMEMESQIALEVRQKWLELQTALERIEVARQAIVQADENLRVARDRYQQQTGTNTEVLDAETLQVQAHTNFFNSSYEAALARLRLSRAVGTL